MITTDTGAKKIENTDNWRLIFDAHNDSVDAEDKIVPEMAPIVNGNKSTVGAAIGEYVLVRNSSITGITDGAYTAAKAIPANTTIDSTYLTAVGTGGALNALNSNLPSVTTGTGTGKITSYEIYKFPNGLMIEVVHLYFSNTALNVSWGNIYQSADISCGNWPVEFTGTPFVTYTTSGSTNSAAAIEYLKDVSKTAIGTVCFFRGNTATGLNINANVVAFGHWK